MVSSVSETGSAADDADRGRGATWRPTATLETLKSRARLLQAVRDFFASRDYWEVETPLLSAETCIDTWIEPFSVPLDPGLHLSEGFLQSSPEFAMKRLLAAGADRIFQVTKAFRAGEVGKGHNPEFTMIEWYACGETDFDQMTFVEDLVRRVMETAEVPLAGPVPRLTYDAAFEAAWGAPILQLDAASLARLAESRCVPLPPGIETDLDGLRNLLLATVVEPYLATFDAVFLYDFPASQAALARIRGEKVPVAARFELYLRGDEICNGYHELQSADELRERMVQQNERRAAAGLRSLPDSPRLLAAMEAGLPDSAGVALGFDRLVMHCLGLATIQEVIPFPIDRA